MFSTSSQAFGSRTPEFRAVVLAMSEDDDYMAPLTDTENIPKALLPIANRPMLWYVLQWLEQGGVLDIKIVTTREWEMEISNYIEVYKGLASISVNASSNSVGGSADVLRQVTVPQAKGDVIVVPCDLIVDVPATQFLDLYRIRRPAIATLFYEPMRSEGGGGSSKVKTRLPCVGIDQPSSRLVLLQDFEKGDSEMPLAMSLVRQFPSMALSNKMQDSHVYVLQKWVLDYIEANPQISSLKYDLLPLFVRAQSNPSLLESHGISQCVQSRSDTYFNGRGSTATDKTDMPDGVGLDNVDSDGLLSVFAYVRRGGINGRADQIPRYCDLNYAVSRISKDRRIHETATMANQSQVSADSMVGASSQLDEQCSIKRSVMGAHCVIGRRVKIINSVIMDHVTIGDGVTIESSVIGNLAKVGDNVLLKDCEVGPKASVPRGSSRKGNTITSSSSFFASNGDQIDTEFLG